MMASEYPTQDHPSNRLSSSKGHSRAPGGEVYEDMAFEILKNSYEKRLKELHEIILRVENDIESDELLRQMKEDEISAKFRKERIKEILTETIQNEREVTISRLMETNALLLGECRRLEDERVQLIKNVNDKHTQLAKKIDEVETLLDKERSTKEFLQDECDKLTQRLKTMTIQNEEFARMKEDQISGEVNELRAQLFDVCKTNDELGRKVGEYELNLRERIKEIGMLEEERGELLRIVEGMKGGMLDENMTLRKENEGLKIDCMEMSEKVDSMASQMARLVDVEKKATEDMIKEIKSKYKTKIRQYKKKVGEYKAAHEKIMEEYEELRTKSQQDMMIIKGEWERKCSEMAGQYQSSIDVLKARHMQEIADMQEEYQQLFDQKVREMQEESVMRNKTSESLVEMKDQVDKLMRTMEKDYVPKAKHEAILNQQALEIRSQFGEELRDVKNRGERDFAEFVKEFSDKKSKEFEEVLSLFKNNITTLETTVEAKTKEAKRFEELYTNCNTQLDRLQKDLLRVTERSDEEFKRKGLLESENEKIKAKLSEVVQDKTKLALLVDEQGKELEEALQDKKVLESQLDAVKGEILRLNDKMIEEAQNYGKQMAKLRGEFSVKIEEQEGELNKFRTKTRELEEELGETRRGQMSERHKVRNSIDNIKNRFGQVTIKRLREFKGDIANIREDLDNKKRVMEVMTNEFVEKVGRKMASIAGQYKTQVLAEKQSFVGQFDQVKQMLDGQMEEIVQLRTENAKLLMEYDEVQGRLARALNQKEDLIQELENTKEEYLTYRENISTELSRIKLDTATLIDTQMKRAYELYEAQFMEITENLENVKGDYEKRLAQLMKQVEVVSEGSAKDLGELTEVYEKRMNALKKEAKEKENTISQLKKELKKELENQNQLTKYNELMKEDGTRYNEIKLRMASEIDRLKKEMKEMSERINNKEHVIEELSRVNEDYKQQLKRFKGGQETLPTQQAQTPGGLRMRAPSGTPNMITKELEEIQNLITNSYNQLGGGVEPPSRTRASLGPESRPNISTSLTPSVKSGSITRTLGTSGHKYKH